MLALVAQALPAQPLQTQANAPQGLSGWIAASATGVIREIGYGGLFAAMTLESMFLPVPSEAVMPFAGFLVADRALNGPLAVLVATLGSLSGSLLSYWIAAAGGRPVLLRYGRYVLLDRRDIEATERFFARRGEATIFVSRFVPVVRHLISLPAGLAGMRLGRFVLFTGLGAAVWNALLTVAGYLLREHWERVMRSGRAIDLTVAGLLALLVVWYLSRHLARRARDRVE